MFGAFRKLVRGNEGSAHLFLLVFLLVFCWCFVGAWKGVFRARAVGSERFCAWKRLFRAPIVLSNLVGA